MLQTCMFRSTSPPGHCDKAVSGYHSFLENGNPKPSRMLKKSASVVLALSLPVGLFPNANQQSPLLTKLKGPMKGGNDYAEE